MYGFCRYNTSHNDCGIHNSISLEQNNATNNVGYSSRDKGYDKGD